MKKKAKQILLSVVSGTIKSATQLKKALRTGVRVRMHIVCDLHQKAFLKTGQQWQPIDYHTFKQARKKPAPMGTIRVTMDMQSNLLPSCQCINLLTAENHEQ